MEKQNLLILDLDETLIYATEYKLDIAFDFQYAQYFVYKRPYLNAFLSEMSKVFKLAIWSSACESYVNAIIAIIKPSEIEFEFVWSENRCTLKYNNHLDIYVQEKRLKKIKKIGFHLDKTIIVDDSPEKIRMNFGNAIYISKFEGNPEDDELKLLSIFLKLIKDSENLRQIEKRFWRNNSI